MPFDAALDRLRLLVLHGGDDGRPRWDRETPRKATTIPRLVRFAAIALALIATAAISAGFWLALEGP